MVDNIARKRQSYDLSEDVCERTVVDDAFIQKLIDRFVNTDACQTDETIRNCENLKSKAVLIFSAEHDQSNFSYMLNYAFDEEGIARDYEFEITSDGSRLYVSADHPQKGRIEEILNSNSNIEETFKRMYGSYGRIASYFKYMQFSKEYMENQRDAVVKYREIFDNKYNGRFSVFVSSKGYEPKYVL